MKGKISSGVFRVMAVVSALAIVGGYVVWRQTEANKNAAEQQAAAKEKEKTLREVDESRQEDQKELEMLPGSKNPVRSLDVLPGSKRGDFTIPLPGIPVGSSEVSNIETRLLPGSKSMPMPVLTEEQLEKIREEENKGKVAPENLLPSSKIGIIRLPIQESEPPEQKKPKLLPGSKGGIFIPEEPETQKSE